jgi:hypothetical protein
MKKNEMSIDREIMFMTKYQLTADELFVLRLIFYAQEGHDEYLSSFFSECQLGHSLKSILQSLQAKGIISKSYVVPEAGSVLKATEVKLDASAVSQFMQHSTDMGMELLEAYPAYTVINGRRFSLRNISKHFKNLDDMCWHYGKAIQFDLQKHVEILELLEYGKANNLIHSSLTDFIISHGWLAIEAYKNEVQ